MIFKYYLYTISDCSEPMTLGYNYSFGTGTTYGETYDVECTSGYIGTANPKTVTCKESGNWTVVSGCTLVGKFTKTILVILYYTFKNVCPTNKSYVSVLILTLNGADGAVIHGGTSAT